MGRAILRKPSEVITVVNEWHWRDQCVEGGGVHPRGTGPSSVSNEEMGLSPFLGPPPFFPGKMRRTEAVGFESSRSKLWGKELARGYFQVNVEPEGPFPQ